MNRINVYTYPTDEYDQDGPKLTSWFNADRAERFGEDTDFDGNNHISVNTRTQWNHEELYRTAKGRWVLGKYSNYQGTMPSYEFIDGEQAKTWLTINQHDEAVERHFGEVEDERGPGRTPIDGDPISIKLGDVQAAVDAYAASRNIKRAPAIRELCGKALVASEVFDTLAAAYGDIQSILDREAPEPYDLSRTSDALARALRALGSSGAEVLGNVGTAAPAPTAKRQDADSPLAHGNHCAGSPRFSTDSTGQYNAECDACGFEITGCETKAEAGGAFYATVRTELLTA